MTRTRLRLDRFSCWPKILLKSGNRKTENLIFLAPLAQLAEQVTLNSKSVFSTDFPASGLEWSGLSKIPISENKNLSGVDSCGRNF